MFHILILTLIIKLFFLLYARKEDAVEHEKHDIENDEDGCETQDVLLVAYHNVDKEYDCRRHHLQCRCCQVELAQIGW